MAGALALPKPHQDRLEAIVEREATKFWKRVERAHKARIAKSAKRRKGTSAV